MPDGLSLSFGSRPGQLFNDGDEFNRRSLRGLVGNIGHVVFCLNASKHLFNSRKTLSSSN